jgi:hypothetical protein
MFTRCGVDLAHEVLIYFVFSEWRAVCRQYALCISDVEQGPNKFPQIITSLFSRRLIPDVMGPYYRCNFRHKSRLRKRQPLRRTIRVSFHSFTFRLHVPQILASKSGAHLHELVNTFFKSEFMVPSLLD